MWTFHKLRCAILQHHEKFLYQEMRVIFFTFDCKRNISISGIHVVRKGNLLRVVKNKKNVLSTYLLYKIGWL